MKNTVKEAFKRKVSIVPAAIGKNVAFVSSIPLKHCIFVYINRNKQKQR
jgi:hypothetical protein